MEGGAELSFQKLAVIILGIPVVIYFMETSGSSIFPTTPMFAGPLQAFALIFVFVLMLMVVVAPFAVIYGNQAPPALAPALFAAAIYLTWRLYRWFFGRAKKNST